MITVAIADDEVLFRSGLAGVVSAQPDFDVIGDAENGRDAIELVLLKRPDVLLMDIQMPVLDGIAATAELTSLVVSTRVLMLTTFGADEYVYDALRAGASGFMLKTTPPDQLAAAIRGIASGEALLAPAITRRLIERWVNQPRPGAEDQRLAKLTGRERDVLQLVGRGLSNAEVAEELYLGVATVKTHLGRVLTKLGLRDRVHAVVFAYETGLVRRGE